MSLSLGKKERNEKIWKPCSEEAVSIDSAVSVCVPDAVELCDAWRRHIKGLWSTRVGWEAIWMLSF